MQGFVFRRTLGRRLRGELFGGLGGARRDGLLFGLDLQARNVGDALLFLEVFGLLARAQPLRRSAKRRRCCSSPMIEARVTTFWTPALASPLALSAAATATALASASLASALFWPWPGGSFAFDSIMTSPAGAATGSATGSATTGAGASATGVRSTTGAGAAASGGATGASAGAAAAGGSAAAGVSLTSGAGLAPETQFGCLAFDENAFFAHLIRTVRAFCRASPAP